MDRSLPTAQGVDELAFRIKYLINTAWPRTDNSGISINNQSNPVSHASHANNFLSELKDHIKGGRTDEMAAPTQKEAEQVDRIGLENSIDPLNSYIHNEVSFDSTRPIGEYSLITHFSCVPIYMPDLTIDEYFLKRFDELKSRATHGLSSLDLKSNESVKSQFIGGKDSITKQIRFMDYRHVYISMLRSIDRLHNFIINNDSISKINAASLDAARAWNEKVTETAGRNGADSKLSMMREYSLRRSPDSTCSMRMTWIRHHSKFQTFTFIQESNQNHLLKLPPSGIVRELQLMLHSLIDNRTSRQITVLDALPHGWSEYIIGRYLQGGNYTIVPLNFIMNLNFICDSQFADHNNEERRNEILSLWDRIRRYKINSSHDGDDLRNIGVDSFIDVWYAALKDETLLRLVGALFRKLAAPLIDTLMPSAPEDGHREFVMCGIDNGTGIFIGDMHNKIVINKSDIPEIRLAQGFIIDINMNSYERARIAKEICDFSTYRVLSLHALPVARFMHDALDVIQHELGSNIKDWRSKSKKAERHHKENSSTLQTDQEPLIDIDRHFIERLEDITVDLTILNDLVEGGITAQSSTSTSAQDRILGRLRVLNERKIPGYMGLSDFLDKRFDRNMAAITAVGRRYESLRRRVAEMSALVKAKTEIIQNEEQQVLLEKVDRLTLFGITYYVGSAISYFFAFIFLIYNSVHPKLKENGQVNADRKLDIFHVDLASIAEISDFVKSYVFFIIVPLAFLIGSSVFIELYFEIKEGISSWKRDIRNSKKKSKKNMTLYLNLPENNKPL